MRRLTQLDAAIASLALPVPQNPCFCPYRCSGTATLGLAVYETYLYMFPQVELDDAVKYAKKGPSERAAEKADKERAADGGAWGKVERRPAREEPAGAAAAGAHGGRGERDGAPRGERDVRGGERDRGEREARGGGGGGRAAPGQAPARGGSKW